MRWSRHLPPFFSFPPAKMLARSSWIILGVDVLALVLPTRGLGPRLELGLALALLVATGWLWLRLELEDEPGP